MSATIDLSGVSCGQPKKYIIGGIEFELKPRTVEDIDLAFDLSDPSTRGKAIKELVIRTLRDSVPGITEDEIKKIGFKYSGEFGKAIMDVNGLDK